MFIFSKTGNNEWFFKSLTAHVEENGPYQNGDLRDWWRVDGTGPRWGLESIKSLSNIIIAYEPVWAIGTGLTASSEQINEVHILIRKILSQLYDDKESKSTPILYGGSVNSANANELISIDGVNGFLIGGASLDVVNFLEVVKVVNDQ